jgi:hypothetical protein
MPPPPIPCATTASPPVAGRRPQLADMAPHTTDPRPNAAPLLLHQGSLIGRPAGWAFRTTRIRRWNVLGWASPGDLPAADVAACPVCRPLIPSGPSECVPIAKSLAGRSSSGRGLRSRVFSCGSASLPAVSCSTEASLLHRLLPLPSSGVRCSDSPKILLVSESTHLLSFALLTSHEPTWSYFDSFSFGGQAVLVVSWLSWSPPVGLLWRCCPRPPELLPPSTTAAASGLPIHWIFGSQFVRPHSTVIDSVTFQEHTSLFNLSCYR